MRSDSLKGSCGNCGLRGLLQLNEALQTVVINKPATFDALTADATFMHQSFHSAVRNTEQLCRGFYADRYNARRRGRLQAFKNGIDSSGHTFLYYKCTPKYLRSASHVGTTGLQGTDWQLLGRRGSRASCPLAANHVHS